MSVLRGKLTPGNYLVYGTIRLLAAGVLLVFSIAIIYGLYFSEASRLPRVQATVVRNETHSLGGGTKSEEIIYTPVLRYSVGGQDYITNRGVQAASEPYEQGSKVEIRYDPSDPGHPFQPNLSRTRTLWVMATTAAIPGVTLLVQTARQMTAIRRTLRPTK